jgi:hypothetical protein
MTFKKMTGELTNMPYLRNIWKKMNQKYLSPEIMSQKSWYTGFPLIVRLCLTPVL